MIYPWYLSEMVKFTVDHSGEQRLFRVTSLVMMVTMRAISREYINGSERLL